MSLEFRHICCPTCGVDDTEFWGRRGGVAHRAGAGEVCTIVRGRRCTLLYPSPVPYPSDLDALYSGEDDYFGAHAEQSTKTDSRDSLIADLERLAPGKRLLDVGAGLGETVAAAVRRGWEAFGVEVAARFVEKAEKLIPGRVFHGSLEALPPEIKSHGFDAVVLAAVLEHLHEPSKILANICRLLRRGGILFLDVPNESGLYFRVGNLWNKLQGRLGCESGADVLALSRIRIQSEKPDRNSRKERIRHRATARLLGSIPRPLPAIDQTHNRMGGGPRHTPSSKLRSPGRLH